MAIQTQIEQKLAALTPDVLQVENESHMHNVPANSETHFKVTLVSDSFDGMMPVKRHQQIYALLADELSLAGDHALVDKCVDDGHRVGVGRRLPLHSRRGHRKICARPTPLHRRRGHARGLRTVV